MRRDGPTAEERLCAVYLEPADDDALAEVNVNAADVLEEHCSSDGNDSKETSCESSGNFPVDPSLAIPAISLHNDGETVCVLDVSSDGLYVVTRDPCGRAYVWNVFTGALVFQCHRSVDIGTQEVTCAAFSEDATLLCTGDTCGRVCVWGVRSQLVEREFVTFAHTKWVAWDPKGKLLVAGTVDGILWRWKMRGGKCKTMQGSFTTCDDGRVLADGRRAAAVYDDGSVCIWDLKRARLLHGRSGSRRVHSGAVTSLDVSGELVATGADTVQVLDADTGEAVAVFPCIELCSPPGSEDNNVGTLSLESQHEALAAGTYSGVLAILDLSSVLEKQRYVHPDLISRAVWGAPHTVFTACADGFVRVFDVRADRHGPTARWKCSSSGLHDLALTPDGLSFVTSCNGGTCKVFRVAMLA